jgi:hypothetical protein
MKDEGSDKRLSVKLNQYFEHNIKLSFVWDESVIIVTNDDKVYEFERRRSVKTIQYLIMNISNDNKKIKTIIDYSIVNELCNKQVIDFKNSHFHVIARTSDGKVYCWGRNAWKGCLGNGKNDWKTYKPELNEYLSEKQIIDICCGKLHTIVLTNSGEVYSWGCNDSGQIGIASDSEAVLIPQQVVFQLRDGEKVKAISCGLNHSLALSDGGRVFSWGDNHYKQMGVSSDSLFKSSKPILIEMNEIIIEKISCGRNHNLLLSREADIYVFGDNSDGQLGIGDKETQMTPKKLNVSDQIFKDISSHSHCNISVAFSVNGLYYIWGRCERKVITEPKQIKFNSFEEIFEYYLKVNFKPIENRIIEFDYNFLKNGKYEADFKQIKELGEGGYGKVFKVEKLPNDSFEDYFILYKKLDKENFAIKKIEFKAEYEKEFLNELETSPIVYELDNQNVIKYHNIWFENDFTLKNGNKIYSNNFILHIQMELCDKTLNEFIEEIKNDSDLYSNEMLTELGFNLANVILIQILKGVNYLHKQNPQIIHRDLSPWNIMLKIGDPVYSLELEMELEWLGFGMPTFEKYSKSIVKIADLGLATIHKYASHSHTEDRGHISFQAPEVEKGGDYDTRADIYSLGLVLQQLFIIDVNRY